ncbi:hypothetical protein F5878DRAFT_617302 [Lentinula raphanica]|uniref:Uncharacterized protein n=1 Tax=Lentinula raphanica TaxID=153919 RepID=A0AA38PAP3_9AGAR|nr:hypothetical protein F5878DRAFT_617302 [Lentinula raphanica]
MTSSDSISSTSLFSSASITSTTPIQSGTPSGGNSTNNNSGSDGGDSIANSASLYLYTFLATLVLLLGVSAAIVVRSLLLRRRHRRMIEEAIRNGTYVPPSVLASARGRVDLANKPKMWEATVRSEWNGKEGGWADILPVSASISSPTIPFSITSPSPALESNASPHIANPTPAPATTSVGSRLRSVTTAPARVAVGMWRLISPSSHHRSDSVTLPTTHNNNDLSSVETKPHQTLPYAEMGTPTQMEVAVLIAMPGALAAVANRSKEDAEEEDLPHVEMGMAEVVIPSGVASSTHSLQEGSSHIEQP